jgi:fructokinase
MPKPEVFFFDRCSRGAVELAAAFRRTGALVVFEPSSQGDPSIFQDALGLAHIVKYSHERWAGSERIGLRDANWLLVETLGQDGLRFYSRSPSYRSKGWENLPGLQVEQHKDAAGSGDWCTAGLIACLGAGGAEGMRNADEQEIRRALQQGQSLAAWNCGYEGARGGMYSTQREKLGELARTIAPTFSALRLEPRTAVKDGSARIKRVGFKCCHVSNHHMI